MRARVCVRACVPVFVCMCVAPPHLALLESIMYSRMRAAGDMDEPPASALAPLHEVVLSSICSSSSSLTPTCTYTGRRAGGRAAWGFGEAVGMRCGPAGQACVGDKVAWPGTVSACAAYMIYLHR